MAKNVHNPIKEYHERWKADSKNLTALFYRMFRDDDFENVTLMLKMEFSQRCKERNRVTLIESLADPFFCCAADKSMSPAMRAYAEYIYWTLREKIDVYEMTDRHDDFMMRSEVRNVFNESIRVIESRRKGFYLEFQKRYKLLKAQQNEIEAASVKA